jgi:hypothetical protein
MFDLTFEQPIRLHEAARLAGLGRGGRPIHFSTVLRWILKGVKSPSGATVRLEALRIGAHWVTSREALQRFSERLTPRLDAEEAPAVRSPAKRQRASERAAHELDKLGI